MTTTATTLTKPNRYPANCVRCNGRIDAGAGLLARTTTGKWAADHDGPCPERPAPATRELVNTDGIYRTDDGRIFKVQKARQGNGRLYAKRLHFITCPDASHCGHPTIVDAAGNHAHGHFEYASGAIYQLTAEMRLSDADAARYGVMYGICVACGADLTDETSIKIGIGPVCRGKYF
jgi:hypothetical protein